MKTLALFLFTLATAVAATSPIPADRTIDWTLAGVPNLEALRATRTTVTNVTGLDTNGVLDCSAAINAVIATCPSNGIVQLPAGKLMLSNALSISAATLNRGGYITLRGAGADSTILLHRAPSSVLNTGNNNFGDSNNIVITSLIKGTTNITLSAAPEFEVGDVLRLSRQDEAATNWVLVFNNNNLTNSWIVTNAGPAYVAQGNWYRISSADVFKQYVLCTAINGTEVTFWPPLYWSWTNPPGLYAYAKRVWGASRFVGIESLGITNELDSVYSVYCNGTYATWMKDCNVWGYGSSAVSFLDSVNCEVRGCKFVQNKPNPPGGNVSALGFYGSSSFKVEDNIFSGYWEQLLMESSASGGAVLYNYFTNQWHAPSATTSYQQPDIYLNHLAHDMMVLLEGNIMNGVQADNYHGGSSHFTFYRNWVHGMNQAFGTNLNRNIKPMDFVRYSRYFNAAGNVIGNPSLAGALYDAPTNGTFSVDTPAMWRLGFADMGNNCATCNEVFILYNGVNGEVVWGYPIGYDYEVVSTLLRTNNYDYATGTIADGVASDLPNSLVYNSAPSWWGTNRWPAIQPDAEVKVAPIPAELRYLGISSGESPLPPAQSGSARASKVYVGTLRRP